MAKAKQKTVLLVANGHLRLSANQNCWEEQDKIEKELAKVLSELGGKIKRAHPLQAGRKARGYFQPARRHGCLCKGRSQSPAHRCRSSLAICSPARTVLR